MKKNLNSLKHILLPALLFSFITGTLTGIVVLIYRLVAGHVIEFSETAYAAMRTHPWWILVAVAVILLIAFVTAWMYRRQPNIRGGGIPTAIGILRGLIPFGWWQNLIGVWASSLMTFLVAVPLGTEGPGVQIGTAIGRGTVCTLAPRHRAWDRYVMTGGACAGFTAATGAPISGIMFAVEEAHQRISPMILMVAFFSVLFSEITVEALAPFLGIQPDLFPGLSDRVVTLSLRELWIPLVIGLAVGVFSALFLKAYPLVKRMWKIGQKHGRKPLSAELRIFLICLVTLAVGLISYDFVSTGHHFLLRLIEDGGTWYVLILILLFRAFLMLAANTTGITGGMFLPILTLGGIMATLCGQAMAYFGWLTADYQTTVIVLGITACVGGMIKTPLTAIFFAAEALGCGTNILPVILAVTVSYLVTELCGAKSINEAVVEDRVFKLHETDPAPIVIDTYVTVQPHTFAVGKQIRDIFWPSNLFVLSITHDPMEGAEVDEHGDKTLHAGDVLHVRYLCYNEGKTRNELFAIVGEQSLVDEEKVKKV